MILGRASREGRAEWFALTPCSMLIAVCYLGWLVVSPLLRGSSGGNTIIDSDAGSSFVITAAAALLIGWMFWRLTRRSDGMANMAFCMVIVAAGAWTTILTGPQRAHAEAAVRDVIEQQLGEAAPEPVAEPQRTVVTTSKPRTE